MKILLSIFFLAGLVMPAFPQEQWGNEGELESIEIEIINQRQITLPKAERNFEKIPPRPSEPIQAPMQYDFRSFAFRTRQINPVMRPLKIKNEEPSRVYGGYLTAGYGNYASPYLEGFINSGRDKNKLIGAHGLFSGSDKGPVDGINSGSGLSMFSLYGKTFTDHVSLSGDVGFENRSTHFYGYPEGTNVEAKDIKQSYNLFKIKGQVSNVKATSFGYDLGAGFNYMADRFEASESEVDLDFASRYKISEDTGLGLSAQYYLINRKDVMVEAKPRSLFSINPRYEFYPVPDLKVSAGLIAALENDTIDSRNVHAYPDVRVSYPVSPSVELLGSFTGGIEKVSLQTLSNENIWVGPNIPIFHTNKTYDLQAALHTRIGNKVSLNGGFSIASLKNWYFFVNSATDQSRFGVVYETGETVRTNFFASIGYAHEERVNLLLRADLFSYSTDQVEEAWHRPTYKVTADGSFNIARKVLFDLTLISQGGMKAWDPVLLETVALDPAIDLNARIEYMISKPFSAFVQLNNITSNTYPLYLYYPARGFQVLGGLTWSF